MQENRETYIQTDRQKKIHILTIICQKDDSTCDIKD